MAKSTNHTAHNQSYKNHRNGYVVRAISRLEEGEALRASGIPSARARNGIEASAGNGEEKRAT